jgi:hypothetical protein
MRRNQRRELPVGKVLARGVVRRVAVRDPIVEEVRRARDAYAKQFNYDLDAICEDLKRREKASGRPAVSLPPKQIEKKKAV